MNGRISLRPPMEAAAGDGGEPAALSHPTADPGTEPQHITDQRQYDDLRVQNPELELDKLGTFELPILTSHVPYLSPRLFRQFMFSVCDSLVLPGGDVWRRIRVGRVEGQRSEPGVKRVCGLSSFHPPHYKDTFCLCCVR